MRFGALRRSQPGQTSKRGKGKGSPWRPACLEAGCWVARMCRPVHVGACGQAGAAGRGQGTKAGPVRLSREECDGRVLMHACKLHCCAVHAALHSSACGCMFEPGPCTCMRARACVHQRDVRLAACMQACARRPRQACSSSRPPCRLWIGWAWRSLLPRAPGAAGLPPNSRLPRACSPLSYSPWHRLLQRMYHRPCKLDSRN